MVGRKSTDGTDWEREKSVEAGGGTWPFNGRPEACSAFITAAHPLSRLLILSLSSLFSRACTDSLSGLTELSLAEVN